MELDRIDKLLAAYFEGSTNLEEEAALLDYFNNQEVAKHLLQYKPIFVGLAAARKERSTRSFKLDEEVTSKRIKPWWYAVAGMFVIALGIGSLFLSQPAMTPEEQEALMAFESTKNTMILLSKKLNKGTHQLTYVDQFERTKDKFWKEPSE